MQLTTTAKKDSDEWVKLTREGNKRERLPARFARPPAYPAAVTHRNTSKQRAPKRAACVANAKRAVNICTSQKTRPNPLRDMRRGPGLGLMVRHLYQTGLLPGARQAPASSEGQPGRARMSPAEGG